MKKYFLVLVSIVLLIVPSNVYALSTPNKIVNHDDISSVSSYIDDINVRNALGNQKWLFTHASVGENMKTGMNTLKNGDSKYVLGMNNVSSVSSSVTTSNGNIYEINRGNPGIQSKLDIFTSAFNSYGWANKINIAMNKYCYIDITPLGVTKTVSDMTTYANQYLNSMQALESSNSSVTFVYMTVPTVSSEDAGTALIYAFNQVVRSYASSNGKYLLDIADIESHDPSDVHQTGSYGGNPLEKLYSGYTNDGGHPDKSLGSQRVALGWYAMAISIAYNQNQVNVPPTLVTGITTNPTTMDLYIGESKSITATITPSNATNKSVTWTSSDNTIVTVNNGVVTAIKAGTTTITANTVDGNKKATVAVTVKPLDVASIVITNKNVTKLVTGQTLKLDTSIEPSNATNKEVSWASSNTKIATVDNTGLVKALSNGKVTITVTTKDKNKTDKIDIEITSIPVALTDIKIKDKESQSTSLGIGTKLKLNPVLEPANATDAYVWESSDNSIATISKDGVVRGIKTGAVIIVLKTVDGKFLDKIELNIVKNESLLPLIIIGGYIVVLGSIITLTIRIIIRKKKVPSINNVDLMHV